LKTNISHDESIKDEIGINNLPRVNLKDLLDRKKSEEKANRKSNLLIATVVIFISVLLIKIFQFLN
jgi:hypothetical protein